MLSGTRVLTSAQQRCGQLDQHWRGTRLTLAVRRAQAIVFSFQHDKLGRVSQFHFDGRSLVLRQSRLLDFRSDEPTPDAYHMIRWMANRPMGETAVQQAAGGGVEVAPVLGDTDRQAGKFPVKVQGT